MPDLNQTTIPRSFIDLFIAPGAIKTSAPRDAIAARYDLCEDMAQMLTEHARAIAMELGVADDEVIARVQRGLLADGSVVTRDEAQWITRRLAELLDWPQPAPTDTAPAA